MTLEMRRPYKDYGAILEIFNSVENNKISAVTSRVRGGSVFVFYKKLFFEDNFLEYF